MRPHCPRGRRLSQAPDSFSLLPSTLTASQPCTPFSHSRPLSRRPANRGFALILTLLILCLLIIVVVSYLSSMSAELQTASAFTAKARAVQAAQAAVDSATAMLAESFRDFPDSATAWDTQQTTNSGTPTGSNTNIISGAPQRGHDTLPACQAYDRVAGDRGPAVQMHQPRCQRHRWKQP